MKPYSINEKLVWKRIDEAGDIVADFVIVKNVRQGKSFTYIVQLCHNDEIVNVWHNELHRFKL